MAFTEVRSSRDQGISGSEQAGALEGPWDPQGVGRAEAEALGEEVIGGQMRCELDAAGGWAGLCEGERERLSVTAKGRVTAKGSTWETPAPA